MADMLLAKISSLDATNQDLFSNGSKILTQHMIEISGDKRSVLKNGSGLSTDNSFSVRSLNKLLINAAKDFMISPDYISSLPLPRTEGSLKKRFLPRKYDIMAGKIRAKTGTLTKPISVSAIAGYMQHPKHGLIAFTIINNGIKGKRQPNIVQLRSDQERLIYKVFSDIN